MSIDSLLDWLDEALDKAEEELTSENTNLQILLREDTSD
jgi:hypothetical protein